VTAAEPRFASFLSGAFASVALILAAVGIYGVLARAVALSPVLEALLMRLVTHENRPSDRAIGSLRCTSSTAGHTTAPVW
jgi:hypothetical protein